MVLVALLQTTQNRNSRQFVRFVHHHRLKTALESLILLEILLVLIKCGSTNSTQFTSSQRRLQDVGGIHCPFATTSTYQCVNLVDKQDDATFSLRHLIDDTLQTFLKLTLVLGTSHQCTHIQREELLVL